LYLNVWTGSNTSESGRVEDFSENCDELPHSTEAENLRAGYTLRKNYFHEVCLMKLKNAF
jgi:hypothetical protein